MTTKSAATMTETEATDPEAPAPRPLRADAVRNRKRVLEAAEALMATGGGKVQIEEVAQLAGVGVGTVCRHFPTKDALMQAVMTGLYETMLDDARTSLADPDSAGAFATFMRRMAELLAHYRVLAEEVATKIDLPDAAIPTRDALYAAVTELVTRAQAAGTVRADIGPADMALLFAGIAQAASFAGEIESTLRERYLTIVLDGLRPLDPTPLPGRPLGFEELRRLKQQHT